MLRSLITALCVTGFVMPAAMAEQPATEIQLVETQRVTAKVNGMVCDFCAQAVMSMFGKEDSVDTVEVDLDNGEIRIALKDGADISDERVEDLVTKSGYDLVEIIRPTA